MFAFFPTCQPFFRAAWHVFQRAVEPLSKALLVFSFCVTYFFFCHLSLLQQEDICYTCTAPTNALDSLLLLLSSPRRAKEQEGEEGNIVVQNAACCILYRRGKGGNDSSSGNRRMRKSRHGEK